MENSTAKALASTGERVRVLYEYAHPIATGWKIGGTTRKDVVNEKGAVVKEDEALDYVGGTGYIDVVLPPQQPGHSPRIQTVRKDNLVNVQVRESSFS